MNTLSMPGAQAGRYPNTTSTGGRWQMLNSFAVEEGLSVEDIVRAERTGAPLPLRALNGRLLVDRHRVSRWRELAGFIPAMAGEAVQ